MLKLLGAILLAGGGLALGLGAVGELSRRVEALGAFASALSLMDSELALRTPPTPQLLALLARRTREPAAGFFARCAAGMEGLGELSFEAIWDRELRTLDSLDEEGRRTLAELGAVLGRYDVEAQRSAAATLGARLGEQERRLAQRRRQEGKAYGALGLSMGLFVTILLL